jgi:hypothetical protein
MWADKIYLKGKTWKELVSCPITSVPLLLLAWFYTQTTTVASKDMWVSIKAKGPQPIFRKPELDTTILNQI